MTKLGLFKFEVKRDQRGHDKTMSGIEKVITQRDIQLNGKVANLKMIKGNTL